MDRLSPNIDSKSFARFLTLIDELNETVLSKIPQGSKATPDDFLVFLEKVRTLTSSQDLNKLIIENLSKVNMETFTSKNLVNAFQKHSDHFKFDQSLKMTEIKQFAKEVIP